MKVAIIGGKIKKCETQLATILLKMRELYGALALPFQKMFAILLAPASVSFDESVGFVEIDPRTWRLLVDSCI